MRNLIDRQTTQSILINNTSVVGSIGGLTTAAANLAASASSVKSTISPTSTYSVASQANKTLHYNMEPMRMPWHSGICFSFHGNHKWSKDHGTELVSPLPNYLGVKVIAEKNIFNLRKEQKYSGKCSKSGRISSNKGGSKRS